MAKFSWAIPPKHISEAEITKREQADVVIIGAGHAGTCAARSAAENGASVLVLEQQSEEKQWILGIGEIGHINSQWQSRHGLPPVNVDEFVNDWQLRTNNRSNVRLIRTYAEKCGECFDWFIEPLTQEEQDGIHPALTPPSPNFPHSLNGLKAWPGTPKMGITLQNKAVKGNQQLAKERGARFYFGTRACWLTKDNSRITGVVGQLSDGSYCFFKLIKVCS